MINMITPPLDALMKKVDCKYTLVVFAAKRARDTLVAESEGTEPRAHKPVTVALDEIAKGHIGYERTKTGIK